jgi:hypothetical protein
VSINETTFTFLKNKRAMARAAQAEGQKTLFTPSPQKNLQGEDAGHQAEISQHIQQIRDNQKEQAKREKQREEFEAKRAAMMQPGQQTLPDQDIQQVADENQQQHEQGWGFKNSLIEQMEMLGMIRKKKEDVWADYDAAIPDDPLDEEFKCPNCKGAGGFDEGDDDGTMSGNPDDFVTCWDCKGSGSIEPTHHPGIDNQGAVSATVFDIRDEQHSEEYDAENAMPYGNMAVQTEEGILDPKRMGYSREGRMKQTRYPIGVPQENKVYHPELQHREPAVYTREWDGQPSYSGMPLGVPGSDFKRSEPMDIAMRLLKEQRATNDFTLEPDNPLQGHYTGTIGYDESGELVQDPRHKQQVKFNMAHPAYTIYGDSDDSFNSFIENKLEPNWTHENVHAAIDDELIQAVDDKVLPSKNYPSAHEVGAVALSQDRFGSQYDADRNANSETKHHPSTREWDAKDAPFKDERWTPKPRIVETGEPMYVGVRLLKHAETPEAKKHKREYDTKYESTPERRKYRTVLSHERRKRHVDGKGGKDMSHTSSGSIVPEDMHANRARHFKERGTLKMVRVKR